MTHANLIRLRTFNTNQNFHLPTPNPHQLSLAFKPSDIHRLSRQGHYAHCIEPIQSQHGTCYLLTLQHLGPTECRVYRTEPYGANCTTDSPDFLWERDIPGFRGTADATIHLWRPPEK